MAGRQGPTAEGTWLYTINTEYGVMDGSFELKQVDQELSGDFVNMGSRAAIFDGRVDGERLSFWPLYKLTLDSAALGHKPSATTNRFPIVRFARNRRVLAHQTSQRLRRGASAQRRWRGGARFGRTPPRGSRYWETQLKLAAEFTSPLPL